MLARFVSRGWGLEVGTLSLCLAFSLVFVFVILKLRMFKTTACSYCECKEFQRCGQPRMVCLMREAKP